MARGASEASEPHISVCCDSPSRFPLRPTTPRPLSIYEAGRPNWRKPNWRKPNWRKMRPRSARHIPVVMAPFAPAVGITAAAHLILALGGKTPYDWQCYVRVCSGVLGSAACAAFTDTYCGPTVLVPRIFSRCTPGGLCMSAVNQHG